jgi:hypothetical protein
MSGSDDILAGHDSLRAGQEALYKDLHQRRPASPGKVVPAGRLLDPHLHQLAAPAFLRRRPGREIRPGSGGRLATDIPHTVPCPALPAKLRFGSR